MTPSKAITKAVQAIGNLNITGNVIPHVWYQRTEFRTARDHPDTNMLIIMADVLYWYRPREVRNEETGQFIRYERKFARERLQYDYARRGTVFGLSKRQVQEACNELAKRGLVRLEYATENYKGKVLHNVVYIEPIPEAVAATLSAPNVTAIEKAKGAVRGRHVRVQPEPETFNPDAGIDDQTPDQPEKQENGSPTPQNSGQLSERRMSQNSGGLSSQKSEIPPPKILGHISREFLHETSFSRDFREEDSSSNSEEGDHATNDDDRSANAGETAEVSSAQATDSESLSISRSRTISIPKDRGSLSTNTENIPGDAAVGARAILVLEPVPLAELQARPQRAPATMKTLRALMQATNDKRLPHLYEQLSLVTGGSVAAPRELFTRLTDPEIERARKAAQAAATEVKGGMGNAGYYALDTLIGERYTLERLTDQAAPSGAAARSEVPMHRSYKALNAGQRVTELEDAAPPQGNYRPGALWRHRETAAQVIIRDVTGTRLTLSDGSSVTMLELSRRYELLVPGQELSA